MTSKARGQSTPTTGNAAGSHAIDVRGDQNVVVTGTVGRDLKVVIGERNVRTHELGYLNWAVRQYQDWAAKYTPLAGIAEVRAAAANGPRLDLPMHFMPAGFEKLVERGYGELSQTEHVQVDDLRDAVTKYKRLVVLGEPGSGKTTTLRRLAHEYAEAGLSDARLPLPVYVPLGDYAGPEPALAYIQTAFQDLAADLATYLRSGRVVLLLDGLNEMPPAGYPERVGRIQKLLDFYPDCPVVVTCRTLDYVETLRLEKLEIKPLDPERQRVYLHRYLGEEDGEKLFWQLCGKDIAALWGTWQREGATWEQFWIGTEIPKAVYSTTSTYQDNLWKALRGDGFPPLLALGRNPYMLVMLAQVYAAKAGVLPQNRGDLFAAFVDTLLTREQKRYDPGRWPGAEQLRSAMAHLAWSMQVAGERGTAVDRAWALARLAEACEPAQALYLCASANLLDDSGGMVRYVHQLLQEYFVAAALQKRLVDGEDLKRYWPGGWTQFSGWEETFVLLAGMAADMTPLLQRLLDPNPVLAVRCIAESGGQKPAKDTVRTVQQRVLELMSDPKVPIPQRDAAGVAINYLSDPRSGVGLRHDGLPDIEWVLVPDRDQRSGQREFIYGEGSERRIELEFWIARYLITYRQFQVFLDASDGFRSPRWWHGLAASEEHRSSANEQWFKHDNHPRDEISWYDAMAFCRWLTEKAKGCPDLLPAKLDRNRDWMITLPTEWQWEKAARGHDGRRYPWGNKYEEGRANLNETYSNAGSHYLQKTSAVGMYPHASPKDSPHGLADLSGQVWEWCLNEFHNPDRVQEEGDAYRVVRGGSWVCDQDFARAFVRFDDDPNRRYDDLGVRVAVTGRHVGAKVLAATS